MSPWKIRASDTSETNSNDERVVEPGMRDALGLDSTREDSLVVSVRLDTLDTRVTRVWREAM